MSTTNWQLTLKMGKILLWKFIHEKHSNGCSCKASGPPRRILHASVEWTIEDKACTKKENIIGASMGCKLIILLYRRGHGFKSRAGLNFFRSYFNYYFSSVYSCEDRLYLFLYRSAHIWFSYISNHYSPLGRFIWIQYNNKLPVGLLAHLEAALHRTGLNFFQVLF